MAFAWLLMTALKQPRVPHSLRVNEQRRMRSVCSLELLQLSRTPLDGPKRSGEARCDGTDDACQQG